MTEHQAALLTKAKDSLRGAEILAREFLYDIAVSRAYYAMFYCARHCSTRQDSGSQATRR